MLVHLRKEEFVPEVRINSWDNVLIEENQFSGTLIKKLTGN